MGKSIRWALVTGLLASALLALPAAAAEATPPPCTGTQVTGTIVAVDSSTGLITIDTGSGTCSVTIQTSFSQPIVALFGTVFDKLSAAKFAAALQDTQAWLVDQGGTWIPANEGDPGAVSARLTAVTDQGNGTFVLTYMIEGNPTPVTLTITDAELATKLEDSLKMLQVDWTLVTDGTGVHVVDVAEEIAQLHEDGMGFGVLVKLFSMAADSAKACESSTTPSAEPTSCGVTFEQLVTEFQNHTGIGKLFQEYGKPSMLGIGQLRKAAGGETGAPQPNGQPCKQNDKGHGPRPLCTNPAPEPVQPEPGD